MHLAASRSRGIETRYAVVPHPTAGNTTQELERKVDGALDSIIQGLLSGPESRDKSDMRSRIAIKGSLAEVNRAFYSRLWTDGWPIVPPTEEAVGAILAGTDLPSNHLVALVEPLKGRATIEKIAINAVMAGARPEYLPVIIAAVEAITDPAFGLGDVQATTNPVTPLLIINGPVRNQLDINCGSGCFGPGWQANATIGRALRLIMINIGGGFPKVNDMATLGQPGKYTMCIGENEESLPPGWPPLHVDRGFSLECNTVTAFPIQELRRAGYGGLSPMAEAMATPSQFPYFYGPQEVLAIFTPDDVQFVVNGISKPPTPVPTHTKDGARRYLFEHSAVPYRSLLRGWSMHDMWRGQIGGGKVKGGLIRPSPDDLVPIVQGPEKIMIMVAGGPGLHSIFCTAGKPNSVTVTKAIRLPGHWDRLLAEAVPTMRRRI
ncbi:MAG: hypothetical protein HYX90_09250 [Chloroflexi bacterium]|nr:hypothetical protein [Chloroflexota bacterium]